MKQYPKIEYSKKFAERKTWAFDKLDGSNVRFEWNKKRGWYKFGTRNQMISTSDPNFGDAIPIFLEKYGDDLDNIFRKKYTSALSVVVFGEYLGENSFAGQHEPDDEKDIVIFDINLYRKGFISPLEFLDNFGHLDIPKLVYTGEYNTELIKNIKENKFGLKEGVICKGISKTKGQDTIWMTKIKTNEWLEKVRILHGEKIYLEQFH